MGAIRSRAGAEFRTRWRSLAGLALLIGVTGGIALAGVAGARRTDSAYPRFFARLGSVHAVVNSCDTGFPAARVDLERVGRLPQVDSFIRIWGPPPLAVASNPQRRRIWSDINVNYSVLSGLGTSIRPKLLAGRLPDPARPDEVAVGYLADPSRRVAVGEAIQVRFVRAGIRRPTDLFDDEFRVRSMALTSPIVLRVVGHVEAQGEVASGEEPTVYLTPAFERVYGDRLFACNGIGVRLHRGFDDLPAFLASVQRIAGNQEVSSFSTDLEAGSVGRAARLQAVVLLLFAGLATLIGIVVVGQALARLALTEGMENPTLRALGMSRRQLFAVAMFRAALVAVAGAALALGFAFMLSPAFPTGLPRLAEPSPGFALDAAALGLGGVAIVVGCLAAAAVPSWRASSAAGDALGLAAPEPAARRATAADRLARAGAPVSLVAGARMALDPGRGRTSVPVRSAIIAVTFSVAAVGAAGAFAASFRHLIATPVLYGDASDLGGGNPVSPDDLSRDVLPALLAEPRVDSLSVANISSLLTIRSGSRYVAANVVGVEVRKGAGVNPTVLDGHWPTAADQIALGSTTMRRLGVALGDTVAVGRGEQRAGVKVVGRVVFPEAGFGAGLGDGAGMTLDGLRRVSPDAPANIFLMRVAPGEDAETVAASLRPLFQHAGGNVGEAPSGTERWGASLENIHRAEKLPFLLGVLLSIAAVSTLAHVLVTTLRRRRRDLAIMKMIGFSRRQIQATVAWQASTITLIGLALGLPFGVAVGRWGWQLFADRLGVKPEAVTGGLVVLVVIPVAVIMANLIAYVPAVLAARTKPTLVLRSE